MSKKIAKIKNYTSLIDNFNVHYYSNFLTEHEADKYFKILEDKLVYDTKEQSKVKIFGKEFEIPRMQVSYGDSDVFYEFSGIKVYAKSWNEKNLICTVLKNIKHKVEIFTGKKFNFVLINRYKDGDDYINFHADDERALGSTPDIVGVSLGAIRKFKFRSKNFFPKKISNNFSIYLEHGSLVNMIYPTNKYYMHSIPKEKSINKPRISLTFRYLYPN